MAHHALPMPKSQERPDSMAYSATKITIGDPTIVAQAPPELDRAGAGWYVVHLSAPGWNVAGVADVGAPGIVMGHNGRLAWAFADPKRFEH